MCDQNQIQSFNCGDSKQFYNYDAGAGEQFADAENCANCDDSQYCTPQCNQCETPSPTRGGQMSQNSNCNYEMSCGEFQPDQSQEGCAAPCATPCNQTQRFGSSQMNCEPCYEQSDPCDVSFQRCNPCEPLGPCQMPSGDNCPPRTSCPPLDACNPMCSPYSRRRYVQPPRRESYKPDARYQRPCIPMTSDTIYKKSFDYIDSKTAASCRMPPVFPSGQLRSPCGEFAKETVTKLSYQPVWCPERTRPIFPYSPSLIGQGPMQALTTQKHDFVPKFQYQRVKFAPRDNIRRNCGPIEDSTVQRLSFMKPNLGNFSKAESCKPIIRYKSPEMPMEFETTQKLSYMPVCPSPKEDMPWARKAMYTTPTIRFARDTVAKLSYPPPGCFMDECGNSCEVNCCDSFPRASC